MQTCFKKQFLKKATFENPGPLTKQLRLFDAVASWWIILFLARIISLKAFQVLIRLLVLINTSAYAYIVWINDDLHKDSSIFNRVESS